MQGQCPVCDANFAASNNVEISEVITCTDCKNALEVMGVDKDKNIIKVKEAPKVEEDWGE
ncbi:lysine biosynthesis protein LysW [Candidatus Gottesmanbacteria bacterium]|nr:lysine biosynthesis protein LysW [Candidatus Gottesmanbacteria bacterium]